MNIAAHAAIKNHMHTLFMCSDASPEELNFRLLASRARINIHDMRNGSMATDDWETLADVVPTVSVAPLYLNTEPVITVEKVADEVERRVRRDGLRLLVVDGLPSLTRRDARSAEVRADLHALKQLAREHDVAILVTGKLQDRTDRSPYRKPAISDLGKEGSGEALTDQVLQLDRDDIATQKRAQTAKAGLLAATSDGQPQRLPIAFQSHYCRFINPQ